MKNHKISLRQRLGLELFRQEQNLRKSRHELHTLFWECTLRCNVSCRHCGSDCRSDSTLRDMPGSDFLRVVDTILPKTDPHKLFIIFTGGEPLMREDLEALGRELYRRELPWGIVTNGLMLNPRRLESLLCAGIHSVTVSLDGPEEAHNWLRRHPQSFTKASEAIRLLARTKEIEWDVVTCVNNCNIGHLADFGNYLASLGVRHWRIFTIFPAGRAASHPDLQLDNTQFTQLLEFIASTRKEGNLHLSFACEGFLGSYESKVRDHFYHCNAGISVASIRADGSISGCPSIRADFSQGNIYQDDFWEVWNNRFQVFRNREWARQGECADCSMFRYCEGNGMHLHDKKGQLTTCHYHKIV